MDIFDRIRNSEEVYWENSNRLPYEDVYETLQFSRADVDDAAARLDRFAPLIARLFPETEDGVIESPLTEIPKLKEVLSLEGFPTTPSGRLFIKCDSHLAIAGSVKARGGIYEVLKHTEDIVFAEGVLEEGDSYEKIADLRDIFSKYTVQVGSTGNLGMSIGIMSAAIGYNAVVHMSADAKEWKKQLLRSKGVDVREYESDYSVAVSEGRKLSDADPMSYFVDDEHSANLFLGYAVAGRRLRKQLDDAGVVVDSEHPLIVYLPCGVGGAPGGIAFGLKNEYGDNVHCFFVEPTESPCMLVSMASGKGDEVSVFDYGLSGLTQADGLAVGRASGLVCEMMKNMISGIMTVADEKLFPYMRVLNDAEGIVIEPSSCAAFEGYFTMAGEGREYMERIGGEPTHILWATGGSLMPDEIVKEYLEYGRR